MQTHGTSRTSKDEGKSESIMTESKYVRILLFMPTQREQPPLCVNNPDSKVTELEHERLLMFPPT